MSSSRTPSGWSRAGERHHAVVMPAPVVTPDQVRALAAAIEQLADAIDVVTETGRRRLRRRARQRARDVLRAVWGR